MILTNLFPVFASLRNLTICLESILSLSKLNTVALVHANTTIDVADIVHGHLMRYTKYTNYTWFRFDMMSDNATLNIPLMQDRFLKNIFFIYFLDEFTDWINIYNFIVISKFNHRDNQINIVNKHMRSSDISAIGDVTVKRHFYNAATLFWNVSGSDSELEAYTFNVFGNRVSKIPILNYQCNESVYRQMFPDKLVNFHGANVTVYGQSEPPKIVKTVAMNNGKHEYSVSGSDVLIADTIFKLLNATMRFNLVLMTIYMRAAHYYEEIESKYRCI